MQLNRIKNTRRNIVYGFSFKILSLVLPFCIRTVMIKRLGIEYLGLNSLFISILNVLNLSELGFSTAIVYNMYKPIAENDTDSICALLFLYKKIYKIVGVVIFLLGIIFMPLLDKLIKGECPQSINIYFVYLIFLLNTVLSYWLFAYKTSLLSAFQREDIVSKINLFVFGGLYLAQLLVLLVIKSYDLYIILMPVFTILNNILVEVYTKRLFPQFECKGQLSEIQKKEIKKNVKGLMIGKVCETSRNSFDSIFISAFLGLIETASYNNYYYIMSSVSAITIVLINSIAAGIGNSVALYGTEKNYDEMLKIDFFYMWIAAWFTVCMACLYQPFIKLVWGSDVLLSYDTVLLICCYFYFLKICDVKAAYVQVTGLWWENRYRSVLEAIFNCILNYLLGRYWGIKGIIIATLLPLIVFNFGYGSYVLFKNYFRNGKLADWFREKMKNMIITIIVFILTFATCSFIKQTGLRELFVKGLICVVLPNVIMGAIYLMTRNRADIKWLLTKRLKVEDK